MCVTLESALKDIPRYRQTLRALPPDFSGQAKMLDLGAGRQWLPFYELVLGYRNITLNSKYHDTSELSGDLKVSGIDDTNIKVSVFDVERDSFPHKDGEFDVVCCFELLEHLAIDPMHMMYEINRVLKPHGLLVLSTPNVVRLANIISIVLGEHPYGWSPYNGFDTNRHNREYTPSEIGAMMADGGFSMSSLKTVGRKKRGFKRNILATMASCCLSLLRRCPLSMRNDLILCIAHKTGIPENRRPRWLYYEMSDRVMKETNEVYEDQLVST